VKFTEPAAQDAPPRPKSGERALCALCLASFPASELAAEGGRLLCAGCRSALRRGAPEAPNDQARGVDRPGVRIDRAEHEPVAAGTSETEPAAQGILAEARRWCEGRSWLVRLPLAAVLLYAFARHLADTEHQDLFKPLNLGIHELGHFVFAPLGMFLSVAGGSLLQCAAPVAAAVMFARQKDFFAITVACQWLGMNLFDVALYAGDARTQALPLVSPGGGGGHIIHDWNYLLDATGLLLWDSTLAGVLRGAAVITSAAGAAAGAWLLGQMARSGAAPWTSGRNP